MITKETKVFARCQGPAREQGNLMNVVPPDQEGLSARDYAAIEMAKSILSNPATNPETIKPSELANRARKFADAIIKDLNENT